MKQEGKKSEICGCFLSLNFLQVARGCCCCHWDVGN